MPEILTRPMRPDDLDRVMEIEHQAFAIPWTRADMEGELNNRAARYHVLTEDGAVMAYAGTWFVIDEGHITNIAVAPECRGKGYGTRVMSPPSPSTRSWASKRPASAKNTTRTTARTPTSWSTTACSSPLTERYRR